MYATLFLISMGVSVLGGLCLAKKWVWDFGNDPWPVVAAIGVLGFLLTFLLLGLLALIGFTFGLLLQA